MCNTVDQSCVFMEQNVSVSLSPGAHARSGQRYPRSFLPTDDFFHVYDSSSGSDSTDNSSINASINVNPIPDSSLSGF